MKNGWDREASTFLPDEVSRLQAAVRPSEDETAWPGQKQVQNQFDYSTDQSVSRSWISVDYSMSTELEYLLGIQRGLKDMD